MNYFRYKVMESSGKIAGGLIQLPYDSEYSVISHLERANKTVIYVRKLNKILALLLPLISGILRKKLSRAFIAEFMANLAVMLRAGLTVNTALKESTEGSNNPAFDEAVAGMIMDIEIGATFSETAKKYPRIFPRSIIHLIRIGEESGSLERMLKDASAHLLRLNQIISDTKQALIYPSFVFAALGFGMGFWFYYVVPKIIALFAEMDVKLPPLTVFILQVSTFFQHHVLSMLAALIVIVGLTIMGVKKNSRIKKMFDQLLLTLPVCKTIINASNMAFITEYFSILLNAGMDIRRSLAILVETMDNAVYREKLEKVQQVMALGEGVAGSFKAAEIFPSFVVRMISVGEQSGSLPEQLQYIANDYRNKLSLVVATIGKMIEPVVLIIAGAMFAVIIAGLFLPIYDLVSQVSGK